MVMLLLGYMIKINYLKIKLSKTQEIQKQKLTKKLLKIDFINQKINFQEKLRITMNKLLFGLKNQKKN